MKWLDKIRDLEEWKRKTIIWIIVLLGSIGLGWWWFQDARTRINRVSPQQAAQEFNLNKLKLPKP